jgi:antitoxin HicB
MVHYKLDMNKKKLFLGSSLDDFLEEEGLLLEAEAIAHKRVISLQLKQIMEQQSITKSEMAKKMKTSRASIDRLLDSDNTSITLHTIEKAALALGKNIRIVFDDKKDSSNEYKSVQRSALCIHESRDK